MSLRIVASVLGMPLERTVSEEGSAFGAALLGGVAAGVFADVHEAVAACVRVRAIPLSPSPGGAEPYEEGHRRFGSSVSSSSTSGGICMISLEGKVAIVTGASGGIGAAVARQLSEQGVKLGLASRSGSDLGLADAVALPCDVRDPDQLDALTEATVDRFGRLDILVANAGVGAYGPFLDLSPEFLDEMIDVNLKGTIYAVRAALPYLIESGEADMVRSPPRPGAAGCRTRRSTAPRSSARSASRGRSTTSCARRGSAARTCARAGSRPSSRSSRGAAALPTRSAA